MRPSGGLGAWLSSWHLISSSIVCGLFLLLGLASPMPEPWLFGALLVIAGLTGISALLERACVGLCMSRQNARALGSCLWALCACWAYLFYARAAMDERAIEGYMFTVMFLGWLFVLIRYYVADRLDPVPRDGPPPPMSGPPPSFRV